MSRFIDLAPEPFNEIIRALDIFNLTRLWICGDARLQWRLSEGKGVQYIKIKTSKPFWPNLIRFFFGLETFSFEGSFCNDIPSEAAGKLFLLGSKLKSLSLNTPSAISAFNHLMNVNEPTFPLLEDLSLISQGKPRQLEDVIPRTVTKLCLGSIQNPVASLSLSSLPPRLTSLECSVLDIITSEKCPKFPNGLRKLDISFLAANKPSFTILPSSIEELSIVHPPVSVNALDEDDWKALSQLSLISLRLALLGVIGPLEARHMPKTLERLTLMHFGRYTEQQCISILPELPQNLKKLLNVWPTSISASVAKLMPRTLEMAFEIQIATGACHHLPLKTKKIVLTRNADLSLIESFPLFLETLTIYELPIRLASILPGTLTHLRIEKSQEILTEKIFELLPPKLKIFFIKAPVSQSLYMNRCFQWLPRTLTILTLQTNLGDVKDGFSLPTLFLPLESASFLPPGLSTLNLKCVDFAEGIFLPTWISMCPKKMKTLVLAVRTLPKGSFAPFRSNCTIKRLTIKSSTTPEDGWDALLHQLPPNLLFLSMEDLSYPLDSKITKESFQIIPKTVESVLLPYSSLLDAKCREEFPKLHHIHVFQNGRLGSI